MNFQAVQEFINNVDITGVEDRSLLVRSFTRDPTIHLRRIKVISVMLLQ